MTWDQDQVDSFIRKCRLNTANIQIQNKISEPSVRLSKKSHSLQRWFEDLESQICEQLTLDNPGGSAGTAAQIIEALASAEYLDKLEANWQVSYWSECLCQSLPHIVQTESLEGKRESGIYNGLIQSF